MTQTTRPAPGAAVGPAHPRAILLIILVSYFLILLDNSVIFTGLPSIESALGLSPTGLSWVQDAYTLVFGGLLLLGARLGDLLGRRRVFIIGLVVFVGASFLIGLAPNGAWLIASRALQGIGAAIVAPSSLSLLTASFPEGQGRSKAVAAYGATAGIGASLGLVVGGAAASWVSWRAGFFINLPIGLAMIALAPKYLPQTPPRTGAFDLRGALLATLGTGSVVFGVIESAARGWGDPLVVGAMMAAAVLLAVLVVNEQRAAQPILPLRLFSDRRRSAAYAARALYLGAMIGFFFFTTQFMQSVFGFSALEAGLGFLPMTVVNFAVAIAVPRLNRRIDSAALLAVGVTLTLVGAAWLSQADADESYLVALALPMLLIGAGQGLAFAPLTSFGIVDAPAEDAGAASGAVNTFHQLGTALGLAILVAVSAHATNAADRFSAALLGSTTLLTLCLLVVLVVLVPAHRAAVATTARCNSHQGLLGAGTARFPGYVTTTGPEERDAVLARFRAQLDAMVAGDTDALGAMLADDFTLTHITGYVQPKLEWLLEMETGQFDYHRIEERAVAVGLDQQRVVVTGRVVADATVYGSRAKWRLVLKQEYRCSGDGWIARRLVATTW